MRRTIACCFPLLLLSGGGLTAAEEAPLTLDLQEEGAGWFYLHTPTDLGRSYQVEWSTTLAAAAWTPALARPIDGTGSRLAFFVGQRADADGAPPVHPDRRDFVVRAYADGSALVQWQVADGLIIRRRVGLDFRAVPRLATAAVDAGTVVTRTQISDDAPTDALADTSDPNPDVRLMLEALFEAYPLLVHSPAAPVVRTTAEDHPIVGTRYWRVRRLDQDADADGLSDFDEWHIHGTNPLAADTDGDGQSDGAEVAAGSSPIDFFNGQRPTVVRLPSRWGDVPFAGPNEWLAEPLVLEVRSPEGTPLAGAPVTATATAGGLEHWGRPPANRDAQPVVRGRTDAAGRFALAWRSGGVAPSAALVHAWTGEAMAYQGAHFLVHTMRALPPPDPTVLAWLQADAEVGTSTDGRVESWSDDARSVTATATGNQRPLLQSDGPLPLIEFNGTHRLDWGSARGGSTLSALFVARATTTRTQAPVSAADPANRTPGLTGQRYLLAAEVAATPSPWLYTPPVPRQLRATEYLSRYTAQFFVVDPVYNFRGYECRPISFTFGFLWPSLPASQVPSVRYDVTSGAVPDPGPANRQSGRTYRLNPNLANCPLRAGASLASCLNDFASRRGFPATYEWDTRELGTYTRRAGTPVVDDFRETYYEAKGYSPAVPEKYELQAGSIGSIGQGISAGTNSTGYFQLAQQFAPSLGTAPATSALALTTVVVTNGRPAIFQNGASAGSSAAPAGGSATGLRFLGALANGTNGFQGTVGDIILTAGALTDDTRRSLEDLLADKRRLTQVDRDADAMPDWWERRTLAQGTAATPTADPDADGLTNAQERARFTLPEIADSDLDGRLDGAESAAAAINPDSDADGFLDGVDPFPTDPANGRADVNGDGIPDGLASLLDAPHQRDSDGDSLPDLVEILITRTNPQSADTDQDTLPDAWEAAHGLDPNDPSGDQGPNGDPDGDGKTNAEERALGTHPLVPD